MPKATLANFLQLCQRVLKLVDADVGHAQQCWCPAQRRASGSTSALMPKMAQPGQEIVGALILRPEVALELLGIVHGQDALLGGERLNAVASPKTRVPLGWLPPR